jgi:large subunit ribosomal protein L19
MSDLVREAVLERHPEPKFPQFNSGDTLNVFVKVAEGDKVRVQVFKGIVLKIQGAGPSKTFTVRKVSEGIGVERIFPFNNPNIDRIEVLSYGMTRKSRLFFLRNLKGRAAKVRSELAVMREQRQAKAEDTTNS